MKHREPSGAEPDSESKRRCWAVSTAIWLGYAAAMMYYTFFLSGEIHHSTIWFQSNDTWGVIDAGRYVWNGALGYVYQGTGSYALPLSFILSAPIAGAIDHFQLVEGAPYPVAHPSAWLLVAPYALLYGLPFLIAVRRLGWDLGVRARLWAVQLTCVPLVLIPCYYWGHFEDLLALTFVVLALRRILTGDWVKAGLLISLAVASKQWAAMLIPLLLVLAPAGKRIRSGLAACVLPGTLALLTLGVDWTDASKALFAPVNLGTGAPGHLSFYATWLGSRTSQVSRALGVVLTVPLAWWLRRSRGAPAIAAAVGLILVVRPFAEAISYSYYWSPALLMAGLVSLAAHRKFQLSDWVAPVVAVLWATPRGNYATGSWWWAGELILFAIIAVQVAANTGQLFRVLRLLPAPIKTLTREPILHAMQSAQAMGDTSWNP